MDPPGATTPPAFTRPTSTFSRSSQRWQSAAVFAAAQVALKGSIKIRGVNVAVHRRLERPNADPERLFDFQTEDDIAV